MPPTSIRSEKITLRLTPEEVSLSEELAKQMGIDRTGVIRFALHKLAKEEGVVILPSKKK